MVSSPTSRRLLLFTKPARPGQVKTRLIGDLSAEQTAELHQAFVDDLSHRLSGGDFELQLAWALDEGEAVPAYRLPEGSSVPGLRQQGDTLGDRLFLAMEQASDSAESFAVVGSDHPSLPLERVHRAFELLEGKADVVLGPAEDGGYYLVGSRRGSLHRRIFEDIPWSSEKVLETTLERCREVGLQVELLPEGADVDTPADLTAFEGWLEKEPLACPRSRRLVARWGEVRQEVRS
ncbi:MAG: TIGR04282 family arsenosugar biosynthesis glycosyltransferase [Acidobacteria bacterium]|nr:TIGR04282 family arsenosugar biosynthesis glycosyltransferase [Acidobacteriota bacterium]